MTGGGRGGGGRGEGACGGGEGGGDVSDIIGYNSLLEGIEARGWGLGGGRYRTGRGRLTASLRNKGGRPRDKKWKRVITS